MKKLFFMLLFFVFLSLSGSLFSQGTNHSQALFLKQTNVEAGTLIDSGAISPSFSNKSPYIRTWTVTTQFLTNAFLIDESSLTDKFVITNVVRTPNPFPFELTQFYKVIITNTNIFTKINTNLNETNLVTNIIVTNTNRTYIFMDGFPPLISVWPPRSVDELKKTIRDYVFPNLEFAFESLDTQIKKKIRLKNIRLREDSDLTKFDPSLFDRLLYEAKNKRLQFTAEEKKHLTFGFEEWDTKVIIKGSIDLKMGYGIVRRSESNPITLPIQTGFNLKQNMRVNVTGWFGKRISVTIDQDSQRAENKYDIGYTALKKDLSLLRELKVGNTTLNIPNSSHYLKYSGTSKDSLGIKAVLEKGPFSWQTVLNLTRSQKGHKTFRGNSQKISLSIQDINYIKRRYFRLPDTGIDQGSLELLRYTSETNTADRKIDGVYYKRLVEGSDYYFNRTDGKLNLYQSLSRDQSLVVQYTVGGAFMTTNSNSTIGVDDNNGDLFLYLWKANLNSTPYVHDGVFSLQTSGFDPSLGFDLTVYKTTDPSQQASFQFSSSDYEINSINGLLDFHSLRPFPDTTGEIYDGASDPIASKSAYLMKITFYKKVKHYQLDFGVIPNTEQVYINGRLLSKNEYTMIPALGEIIFNNPALINQNDTIDVYYEYKPFFAASQRFGIASRLDYKPSKLFNAGATILYGVSQRSSQGAPSIYQTPEGSFMADIDSSLDIARALNLGPDFVLNVKGEAALSVLDKNTSGYAILDDFEGAGQSFSMSVNENRWILTAPTTNISGIVYSNRGHLLYKDYRDYKIDNSYTLLNYDSSLSADKIKDYSVKPGPYLAFGGHLNAADYPQVTQSLLAFDYDFSQGNWVGAAINIAGPSGYDMSRYNNLVMWYKVESDENGDGKFIDTGNSEVEFYVAVGQANEDSDGDGIFDSELTRADSGYAFNNPTNKSVVDTWVGVGRRGGGDGYIQSEDLNRDNAFQTNENLVVFPSSGGGYTDITNAILSEGGWKRLNINIRALSEAQRDILQHATSLSIFIKKKNGTYGRVLVDSLEFKEVRWEDKKVDGVLADTSSALDAEVLGVHNDSYYAAHRFYDPSSADQAVIDRSLLFEKLHGSRSISEGMQYNERALSLIYTLSNVGINTNASVPVGGKSAMIINYSATPFDVSRYRYLNFYIYVPDEEENGTPMKSGNDSYSNESFTLTLGNSEKSYYTWSLPLSVVSKNTWHKVSIHIRDNMQIFVDDNPLAMPYPVSSGLPNLNDIDYMGLGVKTTSTNEAYNHGIVWVDEMYVSSDSPYVGTAFYLKPTFEYRKALWSWGRQEILGPVYLSGTFENKAANFVSSIGGAAGSANQNMTLSYRSSLFKDLKYTMTYNRNDQSSETNTTILPLYLQWNSASRKFSTTWSYNHRRKYIPQFNHSFTESYYDKVNRSSVSSTNTDYVITSGVREYDGSASVNVLDTIPLSKSFLLTPSVKWEDSYILSDHSEFTNPENPVYQTNNNVYATKNLKKTLTSSLKMSFWKISLLSSYAKSMEKYSEIYSEQGFRSELDALAAESIASRYWERIKSLSEGFTFEDESLNKQLSDSLSASLKFNRPVKFLDFSVDANFSRNQNGFAYDKLKTLTSRNDSYLLMNRWSLNLLFQNPILRSMNFKLERHASLSYNSLVTNVEYNDALKLGEIYYRSPFAYNALIFGLNARTNALGLVEHFSDGVFGSTTSLDDFLSLELILPRYKSPIFNLLPKRYTFSTRLNTTRSLSSYAQYLENRFSVRFPISLIKFVNPKSRWKWRDINVQIDFLNHQDYNLEEDADTLGVTISHGVNILSTNQFSLSYSYTLQYKRMTYVSNETVLNHLYGFSSLLPNSSGNNSLTHTLNIRLNWQIKNIKRFDLWFIHIKLKNSLIKNTESLTFSSQQKLYDGSQFKAFDLKLYDFTLQHITDYKFTDIVTGVFTVKAILNRYANIAPFASLPQGFKMTPYDIGIGASFSFDMKIQI